MNLKDAITCIQGQRDMFKMDITESCLTQEQRYAARVCSKQLTTIVNLLKKVKEIG